MPTVNTKTAVRESNLRNVLMRIRSEFQEMPGLRLTDVQAQRLWCLDRTTCELVLSQLVEEQFLQRLSGGHYVLARS